MWPRYLTVGWPNLEERGSEKITAIMDENAMTYKLERKAELHRMSASVDGSWCEEETHDCEQQADSTQSTRAR